MNKPHRLILLTSLLIAACGSADKGKAAHPAPAPSVSAADLKSAAKDSGVRTFYGSEGWQAVWSDDNEEALHQALAHRAEHGLDRVVFLTTADGGSPAARETALTRAALGYASALAHGVVDPASLHKIYTVPRPDPDLAAGLAQALQNGKLGEWLDGLAPHDSEYRALSQVYRQMRQASHDNTGAGIPTNGGLVHPGESDPRVPQVAAALRAIGYLDGQPGPSGNRYTPAIADAVRQFQQDSGLSDDGVLGPNTLSALNTAPSDRARALAVALERRRWLVRNPPPTRIDVNIAAATLNYDRDGQTVTTRKVIDGQPGWESPQLQAKFYRLVANPTWTVPKHIEEKQMGKVSADYLRRHNMVRKGGFLVQQSGPDNALGLVKFDLNDDYAIYLHDTPEKSLFGRDSRHRSHGCIRVQNALDFAQRIAGDEQTTQQWQQARATGKETFVKLPQPITVRLLYHPTWADPAGQVHFVDDAYGWNEAVAEKLGFGKGRVKRLAPAVNDIGP